MTVEKIEEVRIIHLFHQICVGNPLYTRPVGIGDKNILKNLSLS